MDAPNDTLSSGHSPMKVILWMVIWLLAIDVAINAGFDASRPWSSRVLGLTRYFNYGRSIEGKLADILGPAADRPDPIVHAGWIDPRQWHDLPSKSTGNGDLSVAVYGQSFAFDAAKAMQELDGQMTLRLIGGPAAPLSHSFAAYRADAPTRKVDVVVVGILASSFARSGSISALSWTFESPAPFTFPRFSFHDGTLTEVDPRFTTEQEFRAAFRDKGEVWRQFKEQLKTYDKGYSALVFNESMFDHSALVRLMRRGWASSLRQYDSEEKESDGINVQAVPPPLGRVAVTQRLRVDERETQHRGERGRQERAPQDRGDAARAVSELVGFPRGFSGWLGHRRHSLPPPSGVPRGRGRARRPPVV